MSVHAALASADTAAENHLDSDNKRTLSQGRQLPELLNGNGKEPLESAAESDSDCEWISKTEWTNCIKDDPDFRHRSQSAVSIFRVPKFLKDTKKEAYVPQRVSLGPHHHRNAEIPSMGHHKGRALCRMMKIFNTNRNVDTVPNNMDFADRAMEEILKLENEIRDSYEENIDCKGKTLARMLSLDGCFIIEVLRTLGGVDHGNQSYEPIFREEKIWFAAHDIRNDIFMLENQIPLIVLRKLLELELNSAVDVEQILLDVLVEGTSAFFNVFPEDDLDIRLWPWPRPLEQHVDHLLGFLHAVITSPPLNHGGSGDQGDCSIPIKCCTRLCIKKLQDETEAENDVDNIPHAVELRNTGIKFKRCHGGMKQIKFDWNSATIFLPLISISDNTEILFRNLIAFEMCKPSDINYVTGYVHLMDELIDSEKDVALLRRMGVLTNHLGSDIEVADLFNGLGKGVTFTRDVFNDLRKQVNAHHNNEIKVQIANLVQNHLSSPWKTVALSAATAILLLTILQTIFTIISVYK